MAESWFGNKKDVGETGGVWWKDKDEYLVSNVNLDGKHIRIYKNNSGA